MNGKHSGGGPFLYAPVIILGLFVLYFVFAYNYEEGIHTGQTTPQPAEGRKSAKPAIDLRALAKDGGLSARGKTLFMTNCASCHGATGHGDGDRAASLNPKPRNYTTEKFKFGDDIYSVYQTLLKGSPGTSMPSFALLPPEDVMAMAHYVRSIVPAPAATTDEIVNQFPAVEAGATTSSTPAAAVVSLPGDTLPRVPIQFAMQQLAKPPTAVSASNRAADVGSAGAGIYTNRCAGCHGVSGEGAQWKVLSVSPYRYGTTLPLGQPGAAWLDDRKLFGEIVTHGLPGDVMPGCGGLTTVEMDELYAHVRGLSASNR